MDLTKPIHVIVDSVSKGDSSLVEILSAYLTPVIAVLAFLIAYQQYRINKQRFLFETYKERLEIYNTVQNYIMDIITEGTTTFAKIGEFQKKTSQVIFLFDKSVQKKIDEIFKNSIKMVELYEQMYPRNGSDGLPVGEERSRIAHENSEYVKWIMDQRKVIQKLFSKKMALK